MLSCPDSRTNDSVISLSFCSLSSCIFMKGRSRIMISEWRLIWKRYLPLTAPTMSELLRLRVSEKDRFRVSSCTLMGGAERLPRKLLSASKNDQSMCLLICACGRGSS